MPLSEGTPRRIVQTEADLPDVRGRDGRNGVLVAGGPGAWRACVDRPRRAVPMLYQDHVVAVLIDVVPDRPGRRGVCSGHVLEDRVIPGIRSILHAPRGSVPMLNQRLATVRARPRTRGPHI